MALSRSRNVNGYIKTLQRANAVKARIDEADAKHAERMAPARRKFRELTDELAIRYTRLNGSQVSEVRRLSLALAGADRSVALVR